MWALRRGLRLAAVVLMVVAGCAGTAIGQNEGVMLTIQVVVAGVEDEANIEFSGGVEASREAVPDGTYDFTFPAAAMTDTIVTATLTLSASSTGERLAEIPLRFPKPHKSYSRKLFVFADRPTTISDRVLERLANEIDARPSKVYIVAKSINQGPQAAVDFYFKVRSAYLWFKANYALATTRVLTQTETVAVDEQAIGTLQDYMQYIAAADSEETRKWREAWKQTFRSEAEQRRVVAEILKAEHAEWNLLRYVDYYLQAGKANDACAMFGHFKGRWDEFSPEDKAQVADTRGKTVEDMERAMTNMSTSLVSARAPCTLAAAAAN